MLRFAVLVFLCVAHVSCYPRHEQEEARVLSEVWEAMDKHRGDDIIVIPRHDGPESGPEHHSSDRRSSDHHHGPSHDGPSHDGPSHDGPSSSDRSESERKSSETESTSESSEKSDSSAATSDADTTADAQSSSSSDSSERSDESSRGHHSSEGSDERSYDKMWNKFNRLGDMMNRAVDRLRKDDREIRELEKEGSSSSNGPTVFILEVVGAVVVGLILVGLLVLGTVKGVKGLKSWKARRQSERLVDQEAPNMDGTGYQSGYNP